MNQVAVQRFLEDKAPFLVADIALTKVRAPLRSNSKGKSNNKGNGGIAIS